MKHPNKSHKIGCMIFDGVILALPRGIYFMMKGDLKARKQMHNFSRWYQCNEPLSGNQVVFIFYLCFPNGDGLEGIWNSECLVGLVQQVRLCDSCLAAKVKYCPPEMSYRNFGDDACWQHTSISHESYMSMGGSLSEWRAIEGWRIETVCFDWLHNVYLGVARDLVASGIWLFIRQGMYDHLNIDDMDEILGHIHMEIQATCKQFGSFGTMSKRFFLGLFFHLHMLACDFLGVPDRCPCLG